MHTHNATHISTMPWPSLLILPFQLEIVEDAFLRTNRQARVLGFLPSWQFFSLVTTWAETWCRIDERKKNNERRRWAGSLLMGYGFLTSVHVDDGKAAISSQKKELSTPTPFTDRPSPAHKKSSRKLRWDVTRQTSSRSVVNFYSQEVIFSKRQTGYDRD